MTTEIGNFTRKEEPVVDAISQEAPVDDLLVPPGAAMDAIKSFIHHRGAPPPKAPEVSSVLPKKPPPAQPRSSVLSGMSSMATPEKVKAALPTPPSKPRNEADAAKDAANLAEMIQHIETAPEMTYQEKLEAHNLTMEEAMTIVSAVFDVGYYEKTYPVVGTATVTLRTRKTEDQDRLLQRIEADNPHFPASVSQLISKYNLAASMVNYRGTDISQETFKVRYARVCGFSEHIFLVLCTKLARFDDMMLAVLDEGAIENF